MTLDPPYRLGDDQTHFVFRGWAEVDDEDAPDIELRLNGLQVPIVIKPAPSVAEHFPGLRARALCAAVDFASLFAGRLEPNDPFLLLATVRSGRHERRFEYAVTQGWLERVFGRQIRPLPVPPEALQIRVSGAAAGAFHSTGEAVGRRIAELLQQAGRPLTAARRILDFGCGPGRVVRALAALHPAASYAGTDIDAEAIAWCQSEMSDLADFRVNGSAPPLPFPSRAFDLIYSISIFTHLPEDMQHLWLAELRRVLRPGGILITTILNPGAYDLPEVVKRAGAKHGFAYFEQAAATDGLPDFYRLAYHNHDYVRRVWSRHFEVLRIGAHDLNGTQDSVILRRPPLDPIHFLRRLLAGSRSSSTAPPRSSPASGVARIDRGARPW